MILLQDMLIPFASNNSVSIYVAVIAFVAALLGGSAAAAIIGWLKDRKSIQKNNLKVVADTEDSVKNRMEKDINYLLDKVKAMDERLVTIEAENAVYKAREIRIAIWRTHAGVKEVEKTHPFPL